MAEGEDDFRDVEGDCLADCSRELSDFFAMSWPRLQDGPGSDDTLANVGDVPALLPKVGHLTELSARSTTSSELQ